MAPRGAGALVAGATACRGGNTVVSPADRLHFVHGVSIARIAAAIAQAIELLAAPTPDQRFAVHREVEALVERRHLGGLEA